MDLLVSDHIVSLGLTFSIALLVAFRAFLFFGIPLREQGAKEHKT